MTNRLGVLLFLGVFACSIGCQGGDEQTKKPGRKSGETRDDSELREIKAFNDAIVAEYNRVQPLFDKIEPTLKAVNDGGYRDVTPLKRLIDDLRRSVKAAKSTLKTLTLPNVRLAPPTVRDLEKYLDQLANVAETVFPPLIAAMENKSLTPLQKHLAWGQTWLDTARVTIRSQGTFVRSQRFFATKFNLQNRVGNGGRR